MPVSGTTHMLFNVVPGSMEVNALPCNPKKVTHRLLHSCIGPVNFLIIFLILKLIHELI